MKLIKLTMVFKKNNEFRFVAFPSTQFVEAVQCRPGDYNDTPSNANTMVWLDSFDDPIYVLETIGDIAKQLEGMPEL